MIEEAENESIYLSVVVPVYNVAPYLERCIRSLEHQNISKDGFEIICVNDGSTDNSPEILVSLQREYNNIIIIDQENQGVSKARNNGIDRAAGKYIIFIDSDDYVHENTFADILRNVVDYSAQVYFLGFSVVMGNGTIEKYYHIDKQEFQIYPGTEAYFLARVTGQDDTDRSVAIVFERALLIDNKLRYLPNVPYLEDGEFLARILCLAERCIFDNKIFYYRIMRPGSATNSVVFYSEKATKGFLSAAANLKKFQQELNLNEIQKNFLNQPICKFVILVIVSTQKPISIKKAITAKNRLTELGLNKLDLHSTIREYRILGNLYNTSIYLLLIYLFLLQCIRSIQNSINKIGIVF